MTTCFFFLFLSFPFFSLVRSFRNPRGGRTGSASILAFGGDPVLARHAILPVLYLRSHLHSGLPDIDPGMQIRLSAGRIRMCPANAQIRIRLAGPDAMRQIPKLWRPAESLHGRPKRKFTSADSRPSSVAAFAASAGIGGAVGQAQTAARIDSASQNQLQRPQ